MSTWTEWLRAQIDASDSPDPHVIAAQALTVMPPTYRDNATDTRNHARPMNRKTP